METFISQEKIEPPLDCKALKANPLTVNSQAQEKEKQERIGKKFSINGLLSQLLA